MTPPGNLQLVLGPAGSGKTAYLAEHYLRFLTNWQQNVSQPGGLWLCPSGAAVEVIRARLIQTSNRALLQPQVVTFATFSRMVVDRSHLPVQLLAPLDKQRLLQQVIASLALRGLLPYFQQVTDTLGFLRMVDDFVAELKRQDIWPEDFTQVPREKREQELGTIYTEYQHVLHVHELYDAEGCVWKAREVMEAGNSPAIGMVVADGFSNFTAAQYDILRLLGAQGAQVHVSLPALQSADDPGRQLLFLPAQLTLQRLEQAFDRINATELLAQANAPSELTVLEQNLFREEVSNSSAPVANIAIIAASSEQNEFAEIARRVKTLLLSGEAQPDEILLIVCSLREAKNRLRAVAEDFGLPLAFPSCNSIVEVPAIRTLLKLLDLRARDWPFRLLLDLISCDQIQFALGKGDELDEQLVRVAAEACVRRAQLPEGSGLLLEQIREWTRTQDLAATDVEESHLDDRVRQARRCLPFFSQLQQALETLPGRGTLAAWLEELERVAKRLLPQAANAELQLLFPTLHKLVMLDRKIGSASQELSPTEMLTLLRWITSEILSAESCDPHGRIQVATPQAARALRAKHVFVLGLSEESFSAAKFHQVVEGIGSVANSPAELPVADAMLMFYETVTRADKQLTISFTALDARGQKLAPSPFLREVQRALFGREIPTLTMPSKLVFHSPNEALSLSDWRQAVLQDMLAGSYAAWEELSGAHGESRTADSILAGLECVASRAKRDEWGPYEGLLESPEVRELLTNRFGSEHLWSASQLETYAQCPYQFFARQILALEPIEELALRNDPLRRGSLLHLVLAEVHEQARRNREQLSEQDLLARVESVLDRIVEQSLLGRLEEALREIERREILSWAPDYARQEITYRAQWKDYDQPLEPAYFEVRFGPKAANADCAQDPLSTPRPFELDLTNEKILITGQVDRIDLGQVAGVRVFNVIDYKTSNTVKFSDEEISSGRRLQLPLYMLAAERLLLADQQAVPLATGYWTIKDKGFPDAKKRLQCHEPSGQQLQPTSNWQAMPDTLRDTLERIVTQIRGGAFPVFNPDRECTRYCEFSKICRISQIRNLDKVWPPPDEEPV